jgi:hypothetical protein
MSCTGCQLVLLHMQTSCHGSIHGMSMLVVHRFRQLGMGDEEADQGQALHEVVAMPGSGSNGSDCSGPSKVVSRAVPVNVRHADATDALATDALATDAERTKDLKDLWNSLAIVNALLIGASVSALLADTKKLQEGAKAAGVSFTPAVYGSLWAVCLNVNIATLLVTLSLLASLLDERQHQRKSGEGETSIKYGPPTPFIGDTSPRVGTVVGSLFFYIALSYTLFGFFGKVVGSVMVVCGFYCIYFAAFSLINPCLTS